MTFWQGLGLMALGGTIVGAFNLLAWVMYRTGRREERRYFK